MSFIDSFLSQEDWNKLFVKDNLEGIQKLINFVDKEKIMVKPAIFSLSFPSYFFNKTQVILISAAQNNCFKIVRFILNDFNEKIVFTNTRMNDLLKNAKSTEMMKVFIPKINLTTCWQNSLEIGRLDVLKLILEQDNQMLSKNSHTIPLVCHFGYVEILKFLVEDMKIDLSPKEYGFDGLISAIRQGKTQIVKYLLFEQTKFEFDVNQMNQYREFPLLIACKHGHTELIKLLVTFPNIDLKKQSTYGENCLFWVSRYKLEVVKAFFENPIESIDINQTNMKSSTALMMACEFKNLEVIKYFISKGADPNLIDVTGASALWIACSQNNLELVKYFVEEVGVRDLNESEQFKTSTMLQRKQLEISKYLFDNNISYKHLNE